MTTLNDLRNDKQFKGKKLLDISKKVFWMNAEELNKRLIEVNIMIKNLSDIDLAQDEDLQMEAMVLTSRIMMDNQREDSGHSCTGHCCGHSCECHTGGGECFCKDADKNITINKDPQ